MRLYLDQLCHHLIKDLGLTDYTHVCFDFYGPCNYGSERSWIAIYPIHKDSHKEAYQFFLNLTSNPDAGRVAGTEVEDKADDIHKVITSYGEAFIALKELKNDIIERNISLRNYFKYSPGDRGSKWKLFYEEGMAALSYTDLSFGDLSQYENLEELIKIGHSSKKIYKTRQKLYGYLKQLILVMYCLPVKD